MITQGEDMEIIALSYREHRVDINAPRPADARPL
jgi:hypothetical protein